MIGAFAGFMIFWGPPTEPSESGGGQQVPPLQPPLGAKAGPSSPADFATALGEALSKALQGGSQGAPGGKSIVRGETKVSVPTGSDKALDNLPRWFREFDRVLQQLTMG